jgi:hypothetical protein
MTSLEARRHYARTAALFRRAAREWLGQKCIICGGSSNLNLDQKLPPAHAMGGSRRGSGHRGHCPHAAYYAVLMRGGHIQLVCHRCNIRLGFLRLPYWREVLAKNPWKPHKQ